MVGEGMERVVGISEKVVKKRKLTPEEAMCTMLGILNPDGYVFECPECGSTIDRCFGEYEGYGFCFSCNRLYRL